MTDILDKLATKRPPWQLLMTGSGEDAMPVSQSTRAALERIFDLMPGVGHLTLKTANGVLNVTRDFGGDYISEVDGRIAAIFAGDPAITAIGFPDHTATPDDPHCSPAGKASAAIAAAREAGTLSSDEAIRRLKALHTREQDHGAKDD